MKKLISKILLMLVARFSILDDILTSPKMQIIEIENPVSNIEYHLVIASRDHQRQETNDQRPVTSDK
jgi:hypothetical protein